MAQLYLYNRNKDKPGRPPNWYIGGYPTGSPQRPTGLRGAEKEALAIKVLAKERAALVVVAAAGGRGGILTLDNWAAEWIRGLRERRHRSVTYYETRYRVHVAPVLGRKALAEIDCRALTDFLRGLLGVRAPRTVASAWTVLRMLLARAVEAGHLDADPSSEVKDEDLPLDEDRNPTWRAGALFSMDEAAMLLFDERIPDARRVTYALLFYLGARASEVAALAVGSWLPPPQPPLGKILIAYSWNYADRALVRLKNRKPREVPVHPTLEGILRAWLAPAGGRFQYTGTTAPGEDAIMVPGRPRGGRRLGQEGHHLDRHVIYHALQRDLKLLGLKRRRVHDSRVTWISEVMSNEGHKEIAKAITHGRPQNTRDAFDGYVHASWPARCREVLRLPTLVPLAAREVAQIQQITSGYAGSHLHCAYTGDKTEGNSMVSDTSPRSRSSAIPMGLDGTTEDTTGISEDSQRPTGPLSRPPSEITAHLCPSVTAVSKAITALEKGDTKRAIAILRKVGK